MAQTEYLQQQLDTYDVPSVLPGIYEITAPLVSSRPRQVIDWPGVELRPIVPMDEVVRIEVDGVWARLRINQQGDSVPVTTEAGRGIHIAGARGVKLVDCEIWDSPIGPLANGIFVDASSQAIEIIRPEIRDAGYACIRADAKSIRVSGGELRYTRIRPGAQYRWCQLDGLLDRKNDRQLVEGMVWASDVAVASNSNFNYVNATQEDSPNNAVTVRDVIIDAPNFVATGNLNQVLKCTSGKHVLIEGVISNAPSEFFLRSGGEGSTTIRNCDFYGALQPTGKRYLVQDSIQRMGAATTYAAGAGYIGPGQFACDRLTYERSEIIGGDGFIRIADTDRAAKKIVFRDSSWTVDSPRAANLFQPVTMPDQLEFENLTIENRGSGGIALGTNATVTTHADGSMSGRST